MDVSVQRRHWLDNPEEVLTGGQVPVKTAYIDICRRVTDEYFEGNSKL